MNNIIPVAQCNDPIFKKLFILHEYTGYSVTGSIYLIKNYTNVTCSTRKYQDIVGLLSMFFFLGVVYFSSRQQKNRDGVLSRFCQIKVIPILCTNLTSVKTLNILLIQITVFLLLIAYAFNKFKMYIMHPKLLLREMLYATWRTIFV